MMRTTCLVRRPAFVSFLLSTVLLSTVLLFLAPPSRLDAATVSNGAQPGEKTYHEDFSLPTAIDSGAGATSGLDQSRLDVQALVQVSDAGGTVDTPFDDAAQYTFDPTKIELSGGVARLRPDPLWSSLAASWRFEEPTWTGAPGEVVDGSPSGLDGTALGHAQVVAGGLHGSAASFDGADDAVLIGQPASPALGPTDSYTLSAWFRTTGDGAILSKADGDFGARELYLFVAGGGLWGAVGGNQNQGPATGVSNGQWHHAVLVNRDDGGVMRYTLYLDGSPNGTFDSGTATNGSDILLGARRDVGNGGLAFELAGELDEVTIFDRALDPAEITTLYADGLGRVVSQYPSDGPTVVRSAGHGLFNAAGLTAFYATAGAGNQGQLGFQLSTDGTSWQRWDGTAWVPALAGETNDAATVDANLAAFDVTAGSLYLRTTLLGDGAQPVEIDHLAFDFVRAPVYEAREILGPITAEERFDTLRATISAEDSNHSLRLRLLEADGATPVAEGVLAGNTAGFDSAQLAGAGVDLSMLGPGTLHVEVIFENALGDDGSARLEDFSVDFLDPVVLTSFDLIQESEPADGTNFTYDVTVGTPTSVVLDHAVPDDGDGIGSSFSTIGDDSTVYQVTQQSIPGWIVDSIVCTSPILDTAFEQGYGNAAAHTYDASAIEVVGGTARLVEDPVAADLVASWRFEEAGWNGTPGEVADSGGAGLVGTALGNATTVTDGKLGRAATFDGAGDAVLLGQPSALELDPAQPFTLSVWFKTTGDGALIAKADGNFAGRQFYLFVVGDRLWGTVGGSQNQGLSTGVGDGAWHHAALVNHDDGGTMRYTLYLDGVADGTFDSGTATNGVDVLLGARRDNGNSGLAFQLAGQLDQAVIVDRALSAAEVAGLYQGGAGRLIGGYPSHGPSITPSSVSVDGGLLGLTGFEETTGAQHEGAIGYQLSTDGTGWQWFDGSSWSPAGDGQHNDAATLDTVIASFPLAPGAESLWVRAFLLSDGDQRVELDRVRVHYQSDGLGGVTIAGSSLAVEARISPSTSCTFRNTVDPLYHGSLTVIQSSSPADGTDFAYHLDLGSYEEWFSLDDGGPVDGVPGQWSWSGLEPGLVSIDQSVDAPRWYLDDIQCSSTSGTVTTIGFDDPAAYVYDATKIEVLGGTASLRPDPLFDDLLAYWRLDEADWSGGLALDDSGNGLDAQVIGNSTTIGEGLIDRAGSFDGQGDALVIGQPAGLDLAPANDEFTVSAWFRTTGDGAVIGKAEDSFGQRQVYLFVAGGQVHANVGGVQNAGSGSGYADGAWHHVALVNENVGGTFRHRLYVDGVPEGDFVSGSATNSADWMIAARRQPGNVGTAFELDGEVDEVAIFGRALGDAELTELHGGGSGRAIGGYALDGPSIVEIPGTNGGGVLVGFEAVATAGNASNFAFQLSTDGATWQFWNGAAWALASDDGQRNDAATVDAHIASLELGGGAVWVRTFLLSDGSQPVALDRLELSWSNGGSITTQVDLFAGSVSVDLQPGQDVTCTFVNRYDEFPNGTITVELESTPSDGTDFETTLELVGDTPWTFLLDDASPDDGDAHGSTWTAYDQPVATYRIDSVLPQGWTRSAIECADESGTDAFVASFDDPAEYLFDPAKVTVEGSLARLTESSIWPDLLAYWRFEEETWDETPGEVRDTSPGGLHGTSGGYPTGFNALVDGKIGSGGDFYNGSHVSFGSPAALDLRPGSDEFSVSIWFKTNGDGALIGKAGGTLEQRQYYLFVLDDKLWSIVGGQLNSGTTVGVADSDWHLATLVNYDAGGGTMRHRLYLDGKLEGDFASGSAWNTADVLVAARRADDAGGGIAFPLAGVLDEALIVDRPLTPEEIDFLYSYRAGRIVTRYPAYSDVKPTIELAFELQGNLERFLGFGASPGAGNQGEVYYQVDPGDGNWYWWEIDHWQVTPNPSLHSTAQTIDAHIGSLPPGPGPVRIRAILVSDGTEAVELDEVWLDYGLTTPMPFVQLGTGLELELGPDQDVRCTLRNERSGIGTLTLNVESIPPDGTDFEFEHQYGSVIYLDDAQSDDGDGVEGSVTWSFENDTTYFVQALGAPQWAMRSVDCQGGATAATYNSENRGLDIPVALGEDVTCTVQFERWFRHTATETALTQTDAGWIEAVATGHDGDWLLITAGADLGGLNPNLDPHVFVYETATELWSRATSTPESFGIPDVSDSGRWGVVPLGSRVARIGLQLATLEDVTTTVACDNYEPTINGNGRKVAFSSTCFVDPGGYIDVVVTDDGIGHPLADTTGCFTARSMISDDVDGVTVTFQSTCDPLGSNPDGGLEIFQWRWQEGPAAVDQLTDVDSAAGFYVSSLVADRDGRYVFVGTNRETGNPDTPFDDIVRRIDTETGEVVDFFRAGQGVIDVQPVVELYGEPFLAMAVDGSGHHVVFPGLRTDDPTATPRWFWAEITQADDVIFNELAVGDVLPSFAFELLGRVQLTRPGNGLPVIYLLSDADFDGTNPDRGDELWQITFE